MEETKPGSATSRFEAACVAVRASLSHAARSEVLARYHVGLVVAQMLGARGAYGERAIERMALRVRVAEDTLYTAAAVAASWAPGEIEALAARTNGHAEPLMWSHFVALTKVVSATKRRELAERCLAESWPVRELKRQVAGLAARAAKGDDVTADPLRIALVDGMKMARRTKSDLHAFNDAVRSRMRDGEADGDLVAQARAEFDDLDARLQDTRASLERVDPASSTRLRVAPQRRAQPESEVEEDDGDRSGARGTLRVR